MGFQKDVYVISIKFLLDFHDVSLIFLEDFYGMSEGMLWEFYGILMRFPLDSYNISMGFYWIPVGFLLDSCGISIWMPISLRFLCYSMLFLRSFYGITMGCQLKVS